MSTERLEMLIADYRLYGEELAHHILDELVGLLLEERVIQDAELNDCRLEAAETEAAYQEEVREAEHRGKEAGFEAGKRGGWC